MQDLLRVEKLRAHYGRAQILFDVSLRVGVGEVVALMGRNGAGKSTTFKSIMGLLAHTEGNIEFRGQSIRGKVTHEIARMGLGYVPEDRRIFTELSVSENLAVGRQSPRAGAPAWDVQRIFDLFPNLAHMLDRPGGRMSGGEQQMLSVARTLMGNPRLVLLDEPSEGIAPKIVEEMARMIRALKKDGLSVLLCEQNLHFAQQVCDRTYVMEKGRMRFEGGMGELMRDPDLQRNLLGVSSDA